MAQKTISPYSFDRIVPIFGYIVERTNTEILSSHFLQFPSWTQIMTSYMKDCTEIVPGEPLRRAV